MTRKNEILQLIRELESLNEFFKNYLTQKLLFSHKAVFWPFNRFCAQNLQIYVSMT